MSSLKGNYFNSPNVVEGRFGRENWQRRGKSFYKGRIKQINKDKNPDQWTEYNKAPRIKHVITHFNPLSTDIINLRNDGVGSHKFLNNKISEKKNESELLDTEITSRILKMSKLQMDDIKESEKQLNSFSKSNDNILSNNNDNDSDNKDDDNYNNYTVMDTTSIEKEIEENMYLKNSNVNNINISNELSTLILKKYRNSNNEKFENNKHSNKIDEINEIIESNISKKAIKIYKDVGKILSNWKSGKLPNPFKRLTILNDWEELIFLTNPDKWTDNVVFETTKMFTSQCNNDMCEKYFNLILLPQVRRAINEKKSLEFHLYRSVQKSLFKSAAFFRGFFFPLCNNELRAKEAIIIGSVISKTSIPVIQSSLAIYKLLELDYSGPIYYLIKIFLNKKYSLPIKVINKFVDTFCNYINDSNNMPVVWHQTLLIFVQLYKTSLNLKQVFNIKKLIKKQKHHQITNIIRNELNNILKNGNNLNTNVKMDIDI